jgi:hypothetical protein
MAMAQASLDGVADDPHSLPVIAQKRLLDPVSDTARRTLDAAFEEFAGRRQDVLETLLGSAGERAMFRQVYPFSPALCMRFQRVRSTLHLVTSSRAATPTSWCAATPPPATYALVYHWYRPGRFPRSSSYVPADARNRSGSTCVTESRATSIARLVFG